MKVHDEDRDDGNRGEKITLIYLEEESERRKRRIINLVVTRLDQAKPKAGFMLSSPLPPSSFIFALTYKKNREKMSLLILKIFSLNYVGLCLLPDLCIQ